MSKRQARIERKLDKLVREQEKKARLVAKIEVDVEPRVAVQPDSAQAPRAEQDPGSIMSMRMEYRIHEHADRDGAWSWGQGRDWCDTSTYGPENACLIRAKMIEMSGLYWHEIIAQTTGSGEKRRKRNHSQSFDSLCAEAQARWLEVERYEDELFRFRTGGKQRIWGFRTGHVFNVVWWDAEHQIYPVD